MNPGRRRAQLLLLAASCALSLAIAETTLRALYPDASFGAGWQMSWMQGGDVDLRQRFVVDPEFGFRPILGTQIYSETGTLQNEYSFEKRPGVERLLFLGDSVTRRGRIVRALESVYGRDRFEYWNAGVESYGTVQEVAFYRRYNRGLRPDHVILTFHNNDFETTPVAFEDDNRGFVVYAPFTASRELNPWLFRHSYLYRVWLGLLVGKQQDVEAIAGEVRDALAQLRDLVAEDGAQLSVLVLPPLKPLLAWQSGEFQRHTNALAILSDLGIRHFDLQPALVDALRLGVFVQEQPGDAQHPSAFVSEVFARDLERRGLLAED